MATKQKTTMTEKWEHLQESLLNNPGEAPHDAPREKAAPEDIPTEERFIQRTSLQGRLTHAFTVVSCCWLIISGLFVFIQPLGNLVGADVVFVMRMSHRVVGCLFIIVPIISALLAPKGVGHICFNLFHPWDKDDWVWMAKFIPYMICCRAVHMPDQDYSKSGQRFADGMVWICCFAMAASGVALVLGDGVIAMSAGVHAVWRFVHDLFFLLTCIFVLAHAYLGGGVFEPYKGTARIMWGDGKVPESAALYHWGKYARRELADGKNVYVLKDSKKKAESATK